MDQFAVEDLLDFSKDLEPAGTDDGSFDNAAGAGGGGGGGCSTESSTVTAVDSLSSNSNSGCALNNGLSAGAGGDYGCNFSGELCVPYDDLAELEWLSNFQEESFSTEDLQRLQLISGVNAGRPDEGSRTNRGLPHEVNPSPNDTPNSPPTFDPDMPVPAKARSKRSRVGPGKWASRLLLLSDPPTQPEHEVGKKVVRAGPKKKHPVGSEGSMEPGEARRCLHCQTDKTPQWRTGPMGPKTLCNACGVRYKSGRLVPEYRPASSPTFMLTKHSNSHRKVLELRRQKELHRAQQLQQEHFLQSQNMVFNVSSDDDYLIHQHVGPDFRQLI